MGVATREEKLDDINTSDIRVFEASISDSDQSKGRQAEVEWVTDPQEDQEVRDFAERLKGVKG